MANVANFPFDKVSLFSKNNKLLIHGYISTLSIMNTVPDVIINIIVEFYTVLVCIIDNGSGKIKTTLGCNTNGLTPIEFPSIVGRQRFPDLMIGLKMSKSVYVGIEALAKRGILRLKYPIEHGIITNWDDVQDIWHHIFDYELKIDAKNHPILLTEAPLTPKYNQEKLVQIMFEKFNVSSLCVVVDSLLSLYGTGKTNGVVMDSGDGVTHCVPIKDGNVLKHAVRRMNIGGRDLTNYMMEILTESGWCFTNNSERFLVKKMKEKLCYIAYDYDNEMKKATKSSDCKASYELPDGHIVTINTERFRCPEVLFKPNFIDFSQCGIHADLYESITKCDVDIRPILFNNIVLAGGCSLFNGIDKRMEKEIRALVPHSMKISVTKSDMYSTLIGGLIVSSLSTFEERCITKKEYDQEGPSIIHRKQ